MDRYLTSDLIAWKNSKNRKPLIIKGARQVGKTWLMKEFGAKYFSKTAYINFDNNPRMQSVFESDYNCDRLIKAFNIETGIEITKGDTLIIMDEIQEVPRALSSLKYFNENANDYFIIAAGSFLGIALHNGTSFPVGKVDFMNLYPLNFREFLEACGDEKYCKLLTSDDTQLMTSFKTKFIERLKEYYYVGGMPEAVNTFINTNDFTKVRTVQKNLLEYYEQDFSKHAPTNDIPRLNLIWHSIPGQLAKENKKFVYGALRKGARASEFETSLEWLSDCGLVQKINRVKKGGMPLIAYLDLNAFKLYMNDTGLLCAMCDIDSKTIIEGSSIFEEFKGALTEQFVLQQLISDCGIKPFYYSADNSTAEIDFIIQLGKEIVPIEVKAGENLQAKSLKVYHQKYQNKFSIRTSLSDFRKDEWLTNISLYDICRIKNISIF